ncbi:MAG TPA: energy transducer TonB [Nitrolancea sp.]|nr:energy transducer TonB [Nitrolancea sp.]
MTPLRSPVMEQNNQRIFSTREVEERIDLAVLAEGEEPRRGASIAVIVSVVVHILLITWMVLNYHPVSAADEAPPIARYVELIRQNPQQDRQFVEAPGKKLEHAVQSPQFSDANREASAPHSTGDRPTLNPGNGRMYTPQAPGGNGRPRVAAQPQIMQQAQQPSADPNQQQQAQQQQQGSQTSSMSQLIQPAVQRNGGAIDWKNAIKEVGKVASLGTGEQGPDLGNAGGGSKGFAKDGPISFETTWYDWGDYAQSMVARIRVNWYNVMPDLLRTGMQGVVTIRFTINRDGHISDVTILNSSGIPPYDFAAKKAIENSSPLNPLPKDFPMPNERVTAMFYYNLEPPAR